MAEIQEIRGNIFTTACEVIVNTVNCVGVMGAGLALECRYRFPGLFEFYERACTTGDLAPGKLLYYSSSSPNVLCFPTKRHWKDPSRFEYVKSGLEEFAMTYRDREITSAAFPHLGCSLGGLGWEHEVRPIMLELLAPLPEIRVEIYDFDPQADDPLFDELVEKLRGLTREQIGERLGLRSQSINRLVDAIKADDVRSMMGLQQVRGVGPKTLEKVYGFLALAGAPERPAKNQMELDLGR